MANKESAYFWADAVFNKRSSLVMPLSFWSSVPIEYKDSFHRKIGENPIYVISLYYKHSNVIKSLSLEKVLQITNKEQDLKSIFYFGSMNQLPIKYFFESKVVTSMNRIKPLLSKQNQLTENDEALTLYVDGLMSLIKKCESNLYNFEDYYFKGIN